MNAARSRADALLKSPVRRPAFRPSSGFLAATGVFGKDVFRYAWMAVIQLLLAVLFLWGGALFGNSPVEERLAKLAPPLFLGFLAATSYLLGLAISGEEAENGTHRLLDMFPVPKLHHLFRKLGAAVVLILLWILAAGLVLGWIGGQGTALFGVLAESAPERSLLNYGRSLPVTTMQTLSLILTGLVAGMLSRSMAVNATVGIVAWLAFNLLVSNAFHRPARGQAFPNLTVLTSLTLWSAAMIWLYPRSFSRAEGGWNLLPQGVAERLRESVWPRRLRSRRLGWDPPHRFLLRTPQAVIAAAFLLAGFIAPEEGWGAATVLILSLSVCFLGAGAFMPEERTGSRLIAFALPVSRNRLFWTRIRALLRAAFIVNLAGIIGWVLGRPINNYQQPGLILTIGTTWALAVILFMQAGALFRLFFRPPLFAVVLAMALGCCWTVLAFQTMQAALVPLHSGGVLPLSTGAEIVQVLWIALLPFTLVVGASWAAFCRSRLSELSERTRGVVGFILFLVLLVWGSFLITMSPPHLVSIITGGRILP